MTPTDEQVTDGPSRDDPPAPAPSSSSASHATPVVHTIPKAIPNATRPAISRASDWPAWARQDTHSSRPADRVTRRAP